MLLKNANLVFKRLTQQLIRVYFKQRNVGKYGVENVIEKKNY